MVEEVELTGAESEVVWVNLTLSNNSLMYIGSFYQSPSVTSTSQLDSLEKSLDQIHEAIGNDKQSTVTIGGDFNADMGSSTSVLVLDCT